VPSSAGPHTPEPNLRLPSGAQISHICAPERMSAGAAVADQIGSVCGALDEADYPAWVTE